MKKTLIKVGTILSLFFYSCGSSPAPTQNEIFGKWGSSDGATINFNKDGSFSGVSIPAQFGFFPPDSFRTKKFSGRGNWEMKKGETYWEISLNFKQVSISGKNGCSFPIMIAGRNGVLENKPPWYLFLWKEEEGGERYEYMKK